MSDDHETENDGVVVNEDQLPNVILHGEMANLSALRQIETQAEYWNQRQDSQGTAIRPTPLPCRVRWESNNNNDSSETTDTTSSNYVAGDVYLSACQILFVATDGNEEDFAIGATCIHLHAMTSEPELAVYLQLTEGGDDDSSEATIVPLDTETSQTLFDGLCKLVSMHPLDLDDDEQGENSCFGDFGEGEDLIWAPSAGHPEDDDEEGGASSAERTAMLGRLDNLLVVMPEFEVQDGQFEDADEAEGI